MNFIRVADRNVGEGLLKRSRKNSETDASSKLTPPQATANVRGFSVLP